MKASLLLLFLVGLSYLYSAAQDESCPALAKSESRKFLEEQDAVRSSPCIPAMITRLGEARDKESVHLLARYLDYMDPTTSPRPDGGADTRPRYPAITALFLIGEPATRELLSVIQTGKSSKIRENAGKAYMFVYRDDLVSGIRLLRREEQRSKNADNRHRLSDALGMLIDACNSRSAKEAEDCKNAARKG